MSKQGRMRITEVLGRPIYTADGRKVGRVVDIEVTQRGEHKIVYLLAGRYGLLHRLHVLHPFAEVIGMRVKADVFEWRDVERIEDGRVVMRSRFIWTVQDGQDGKPYFWCWDL